MALLKTVIDGAPIGESPLHWYPGDDLLTPLERPRGIPIGNLTSQFFDNLYLDDFDHWMKEGQRIGAYLRYVDDMVALDDDKGRLTELRAAMRERLAGERLHLHPDKAHISPVRDGLNLLGYVVFPEFRRLRADNIRRFAHRLRHFARAYGDSRVHWEDIDPCVQSWIGHARHADTEGLRGHLFSSITFSRETGRAAPSA
ncbi:MAG: RNA-directed DNA polymerase [Gammaproteobacteria bacterium]